MMWVPVAFLSGVLVGGFAGGFIGTNGAKKRISELEEHLRMLEKEKTDLIDKYDKETDKALEAATKSLQEAFTAVPPVSSLDSAEETEEDGPKARPPFLITEEEYRNELASVDDDDLTYYTRAGVLSDDAGNKVDTAKLLIGDIYDQLIDGDFDDEDTIYIHNEELEKNFAIYIDSQTYYRDLSAAEFF